ncbi:MAG TPA: hypothetical protein VF939_19440 [Puia sp.]
MDQILGAVNRDYTFTNLQEYNAILRTYNVTVETGGPGSKTRYGLSTRQPSDLYPSRKKVPTARHSAHRQSYLHPPAYRLGSDQQPDTLRELVTDLRGNSIEVIIPPRKGGDPQDHIYVDHETKTAVTGQTLGKVYAAETIYHTLSHDRGHVPSRTPGQTPTLAHNQVAVEGTEFNTRVPQVLSTILSHGSRDSDDHQQDLYLGHRI